MLFRSMVIAGSLGEIPEAIAICKFDGIVGYNALMRESNKPDRLQKLVKILQPDGKILLYESIPKHTQRIYKLLNLTGLDIDKDLGDRWRQAEESIYTNPEDAMVNWDIGDLRLAFEKTKLNVQMEVESITNPMQISSAILNRWFIQNTLKPSYVSHLSKFLDGDEMAIVQQIITDKLLNKTVDWQSKAVLIRGSLR